MENKRKTIKNKKVLKSLALAACFLIAIGATFGITLAWFGGNASSDTTITLRGGVSVGASVTNTVGGTVVPGQAVSFAGVPTVTIATTNPTPAFLRAEFTFAADSGAGTVTANIDAATIGAIAKWNYTNSVNGSAANAYWVKYATDNHYYLCTETTKGTGGADTKLHAIGATATPNMTGTFTVPDSLKNAAAGKNYTVTVKFVAIQALVPNASGAILAEGSCTIGSADVQAVFTAVSGYSA